MGESLLEYFVDIPLVVEQILQHLNVKELLKSTEVSPAFNNIISNSLQWKKVAFNLTQIEKEETTREYRNFKFLRYFQANSFDCPPGIKKIFAKTSHVHSLDTLDYQIIATAFSKEQIENLVELKINQSVAVIKYPSLEFHSMKKLKKIHLSCHVFLPSLYNLQLPTESLEELVFEKVSFWFPTGFQANIKNNEKLKLKTFKFRDHSSYNNSPVKEELLSFMIAQTQSLVTAEFDVWVTLPVIEQLLRMPGLKRLHLYELAKSEGTNWETVNLPVSTSIKELLLDDLKDNKYLLRAFLRACPNIEQLKVHSLNEDISAEIKEHAKNIKSCEEI